MFITRCSALTRKPPPLLFALAAGAGRLLGVPASAAPAPTLRFEHLSVEDGLAQESVLAIAQDRDGFMWFGTQNGLSRFDGYRFVNFRNVVGDPTTLANNWVACCTSTARAPVDRHRRRPGLYDPDSPGFRHFLPGTSRPGAATATATCMRHRRRRQGRPVARPPATACSISTSPAGASPPGTTSPATRQPGHDEHRRAGPRQARPPVDRHRRRPRQPGAGTGCASNTTGAGGKFDAVQACCSTPTTTLWIGC
jgi:hypothetical protein